MAHTAAIAGPPPGPPGWSCHQSLPLSSGSLSGSFQFPHLGSSSSSSSASSCCLRSCFLRESHFLFRFPALFRFLSFLKASNTSFLVHTAAPLLLPHGSRFFLFGWGVSLPDYLTVRLPLPCCRQPVGILALASSSLSLSSRPRSSGRSSPERKCSNQAASFSTLSLALTPTPFLRCSAALRLAFSAFQAALCATPFAWACLYLESWWIWLNRSPAASPCSEILGFLYQPLQLAFQAHRFHVFSSSVRWLVAALSANAASRSSILCLLSALPGLELSDLTRRLCMADDELIVVPTLPVVSTGVAPVWLPVDAAFSLSLGTLSRFLFSGFLNDVLVLLRGNVFIRLDFLNVRLFFYFICFNFDFPAAFRCLALGNFRTFRFHRLSAVTCLGVICRMPALLPSLLATPFSHQVLSGHPLFSEDFLPGPSSI